MELQSKRNSCECVSNGWERCMLNRNMGARKEKSKNVRHCLRDCDHIFLWHCDLHSSHLIRLQNFHRKTFSAKTSILIYVHFYGPRHMLKRKNSMLAMDGIHIQLQIALRAGVTFLIHEVGKFQLWVAKKKWWNYISYGKRNRLVCHFCVCDFACTTYCPSRGKPIKINNKPIKNFGFHSLPLTSKWFIKSWKTSSFPSKIKLALSWVWALSHKSAVTNWWSSARKRFIILLRLATIW